MKTALVTRALRLQTPSPPVRIATFSRFSFGGMGQLQRGL